MGKIYIAEMGSIHNMSFLIGVYTTKEKAIENAIKFLQDTELSADILKEFKKELEEDGICFGDKFHIDIEERSLNQSEWR